MTHEMERTVHLVRGMRACAKAVEWLKTQPDPETAWQNCHRGDWMLWLLGRLSGEPGIQARKRLVLCACGCARNALKHVPAGEHPSRVAIETAEKWARGGAAAEEGWGFVEAAAAAYAAGAAAAAYAADAAARAKTLAACADIVRKHYPQPPRLEGAAHA